MSVTTRVCHCDYCRGYRLMRVVVTRGGAAGPTTREVVCPACEHRKPFGLCCPKCGDCRLPQLFTRHRPDGTTLRVRKCAHCANRVRVKEVLVSASVAPRVLPPPSPDGGLFAAFPELAGADILCNAHNPDGAA